ncbi:MAG TPA: orotidine-5'-phosphate decarboxylase [bacterium]|nr:orotidine-5'-phosphate decarboxylase [bacterium]
MQADLRLVATREALLPLTPRERLILALDVPELDAARDLVRRLIPAVRWFKIGSELFTAAGPRAVALVLEQGGWVFLDLKFHDIPHTVRGAVASAVRLGASMVNVHTAGGDEMMRAAAEARGTAPAYVIGVTALTSAEEELTRIVEMARRAQEAGLDGVVASPREAAPIKAACGAPFVVVTPGIRPLPVPADDQRRIATPAAAIEGGSDFLVVGRPVLNAPDPLEAVERIVDEIALVTPAHVRKSER